jgi:hypothetical protein
MSGIKNCDAKKKNTWKYSAPFQPHSYWDSLDRGLAYADAMREFQYQFKEAVNDMRRSRKGGSAIFNYPLETQTSDTIIFHDEALLPHWREVALACKLIYCSMFLFLFSCI